MKGVQAREMINPAIEVVSMLGVGALIVYIFKTKTSIGEFTGFLYGMGAMFVSVKRLAKVHVLFQQAGVGVERLTEIMRHEPTVRESPNPKPLTGFHSEVRFTNVSFGYSPERPVIRNFNFTIPRGMKVGWLGPAVQAKARS
jgi:ABC-type multidrug transport system fused ATPase/permease subunit